LSVHDHVDDELSWFNDENPRRREGLTEKALSLPLRLVPPQKPVILVADCSVSDAMLEMQTHRTGAILIRTDHQFGILTERDVVMKSPATGRLAKDIQVTEIMTPDPVTLGPEDSIAFAMNYMAVGGYRHIPIVDDAGLPVGLLSVRDILRFVVQFFPERVLALPPKPNTGGTPRYGG
jgi:CBS domain-containing protein